LFLSFHCRFMKRAIPLNAAGIAFGENSFSAPGMARASYARKF
jgi:hypothetical protein